MARTTKQVVEITDDLDGSALDPDTKPIVFVIDGQKREIYLSDKNTEKFNKAVAPFVEASSRVSTSARPKSSGPTSKEIREWAREEGIGVPLRGRIPSDVAQAYKDAH